MRRLGGRCPPSPGQRWTDEQASDLIGKAGVIESGQFGSLAGTVIEARVLDDDMGHAMWITVEGP